ncbi:TetR/AcrR family transcriptional regulator [Halorubrum sp. AD140]|uniref:TetR/AcrR family transcriptional regulator n=1 Tax=Halorubrum sp. AD140 TaxID=3050073 RepID=UPI002ACC9170|nr:TetR/AcrR family transcriptional regulator [Halorubrum sp. AD140]MDZ5813332.1 TetR/AcrR family transcriptional regulator [Halorubrum sp. AD140]
MGTFRLFQSSPTDTHTEMMQATYKALQKHGYADLTMQRIGDEFPKSKSLIYQHYDGKDELLVAFLEFLLTQFKSDIPGDEYADAHEHLHDILDHTLPRSPDSSYIEFTAAMTELRAQAPHNEAYREQFTKTDQFFQKHFTEIIRDGIAQGVFRECEPTQIATFIATSIHGAQNRNVTTNSAGSITATRRELTEYLQACLFTEKNDD